MIRYRLSDMDELAASLENCDVDIIVRSGARRPSQLGVLKIGEIAIMHARIEPACTVRWVAHRDHVQVILPHRGKGRAVADGADLLPGNVLVARPGSTSVVATAGPCTITAISVPVSLVEAVGTDAAGAGELPDGRRPSMYRQLPAADELARLAIRALWHFGLRHPEWANRAEVARAVREVYLLALLPARKPVAPILRGRGLAAERALHCIDQWLASTAAAASQIDDFRSVLQLSDRTLRAVFRRYYGTSPAAFLRFNRMRQARRLLKDPNRRSLRVADIAAECGFLDFGRFAGQYRILFGDYPSRARRQR